MPNSRRSAAATDANQSGMTLAFLESASFWASDSTVALTVLAATAGGFSLYFSSHLSARKEAALEAFKADAGVAIANADARAAEANQRAEEATQGTARALAENAATRERAGKLEIEVAQQQRDAAQQRERAARAETELATVQQRLAPRRLSEEQARQIVGRLSRFRGERLKLFHIAGSEEVVRYANQLKRAFESAGIYVAEESGLVFGSGRSGLSFRVGTTRQRFAGEIWQALRSTGVVDGPQLVGERSNDSEELTLQIWPK